ncbi:MAG: transketolase [Clostridia bacterium]|nr:transketolase [Clostridia bacterium]
MDCIERSKEIRRLTFECIASIGVGHIGGCLSIADVLSVLYTKHMNVDPQNPQMKGRDRLVLSKGHAGPAWYATLASFGYFPKEELKTLNKIGTKLPSHCNATLTPGVDMTTGSLGQGISCAVGMAIGSKLSRDKARIYCIIGDGESQEGQVWEAIMLAAQKKLNNFTLFIDNNKMQIDDTTENVIKMEDYEKKMKAFGFNAIRIDGHDHDAIDQAIEKAKKCKSKPTAIILDTVKGKGVSFIEAMGVSNHSTNISPEQLELALQELK